MRVVRLHKSVTGVVFAVLAACHPRADTPGPSFARPALLEPLPADDAAHDDLLQADISRADTVAQRGVGAGLVANFADDAIFLRGGLPIVRGRRAVSALVDAESLDAHAVMRWQPVRAETSRDRSAGYTYGYAIQSAPGTPSPKLRVDRYIAFWRKASDGNWRITAYAETYGSAPAGDVSPAVLRGAILPDAPMSPTAGALEEIRSADVAFSVDASRSGTGKAFGNFAAPDAQIFSGPGEFVTGPAAITASFGPASATGVLVWHPVAGEVAGSGDLGYTVGTAVYTGRRDDGGQIVQYSKYLTVWRRQRDGTWRYVVDGGSARPAP